MELIFTSNFPKRFINKVGSLTFHDFLRGQDVEKFQKDGTHRVSGDGKLGGPGRREENNLLSFYKGKREKEENESGKESYCIKYSYNVKTLYKFLSLTDLNNPSFRPTNDPIFVEKKALIDNMPLSTASEYVVSTEGEGFGGGGGGYVARKEVCYSNQKTRDEVVEKLLKWLKDQGLEKIANAKRLVEPNEDGSSPSYKEFVGP